MDCHRLFGKHPISKITLFNLDICKNCLTTFIFVAYSSFSYVPKNKQTTTSKRHFALWQRLTTNLSPSILQDSYGCSLIPTSSHSTPLSTMDCPGESATAESFVFRFVKLLF